MAETSTEPQIVSMGDRALVVSFGSAVDPAVNARAQGCAEYLRDRRIAGVTDVVAGYASVTVHFDPALVAAATRRDDPLEAVTETVTTLIGRVPEAPRRRPKTIEIPVCYGGEMGMDLDEVAQHCGMPADEVIRRHCAPLYRVYLLGFVPGFGYLGGLDRRIQVPRRESPRKRIPAGSVGIGGEQTGVYPVESPGGWNIIGRTPRRLFRPDEGEGAPNLMEAGDFVRFVPVTAAEFDRLKAAQR
jgi:inhibitor of KinA